jgi:outer membrane protein assembly factor BamD (BamD/ComL family)
MNFVMVSLVLMGICSSANMYSMEQQDNTRTVNHALKAQKLYDQGQDVLSKMDLILACAYFGDKDEYNMFVITERSKANNLFCKSRRCIQDVLNDKNADDVTKKTVLDIEKNIDAIPWASK